MSDLFSRITKAVEEIPHGWTSIPQAHTMAAAILALRPNITIEIGVYAGKGLVAMGLAHKEIGKGIVYGIDPYSQSASADGQVAQDHERFWSALDHEMIYNFAKDAIIRNSIQNSVRIERTTSDLFNPPDGIGVIRIDGNHGEQAIRDVERYCPKVLVGGILFLDDVPWAGGAVQRALARLKESGWRQLYPIDDGMVLQRTR